MDTVPQRKYLPTAEFIEQNKREGRPLAGRTAVYDALRRGELPHIRLGRRILIPENAFDLMLAEQSAKRQQSAGSTAN